MFQRQSSSIWRRFVIYLTAVTGLFVVMVLLIVLQVSLPHASEEARRATDREVLEREVQLVDSLRRELVARQDFAAAKLLASRQWEIKGLLRQHDELDRLARADRTPANFAAQEETVRHLAASLVPLLENYPFDVEMEALHTRMAWMLIFIFVCLAGTMFVFIRDVVDPLEGLLRTSREVRRGDLSVTFPVRDDSAKHDEIDELATILNDLLANFQEAFLLIVALNKDVRGHLEQMGSAIAALPSEQMREELAESHEEALDAANEVGDIVGSFEFYRARDAA